MTTTNETASQAYARRATEIAASLKAIAERLETHAEEQAADPKNWGYAGDLAFIAETLKGAEEIFGQ